MKKQELLNALGNNLSFFLRTYDINKKETGMLSIIEAFSANILSSYNLDEMPVIKKTNIV